MKDTLAMTGTEVLFVAAGQATPLARSARLLGATAILVADTATVGVETLTHQTEADLLLTRRDAERAHELLAAKRRAAVGSSEYAEAVSQYRALVRSLHDREQQLTRRSAHFLLSATLTDSKSVMQEIRYVAAQAIASGIAGQAASSIALKSRVRILATQMGSRPSLSRTAWEALDRNARRLGQVLEETSKQIVEHTSVEIVTARVGPAIDLAVEYHVKNRDCFTPKVYWLRRSPVVSAELAPRELQRYLPEPVIAAPPSSYVIEMTDNEQSTASYNPPDFSPSRHREPSSPSSPPTSSSEGPAPSDSKPPSKATTKARQGSNVPTDLGPTYREGRQIKAQGGEQGGRRFDTKDSKDRKQ